MYWVPPCEGNFHRNVYLAAQCAVPSEHVSFFLFSGQTWGPHQVKPNANYENCNVISQCRGRRRQPAWPGRTCSLSPPPSTPYSSEELAAARNLEWMFSSPRSWWCTTTTSTINLSHLKAFFASRLGKIVGYLLRRRTGSLSTFSMSIYAAFNRRDQSPCAILWLSQQLSPLPNPRSLSLPATSTPGVLLAGSLAWLLASAFAQVLLLFCPCAFALTFSFYLHLTWVSWTRREISFQK